MSKEGNTRAAVVQESTRSLRVTIPQKIAEEFDLDAEEVLLFKPAGDEVRIRKAESVWENE
jgi:bifunctional DNA-binding transcriptional regulator/antitoxin component of YhaV-PrlF toxin-antitoxin module